MFQAATEPLISLALLAVEPDSVARRLRLTIEESWDRHGAIRAAFFTLDGTDFVVTHHERDPSGTYVWVRKSGPVDPAERMAVLLTALDVGSEAVSYSTWGMGTDLSRVPVAWGRKRGRRVESHQRFWENFRKRTGMYVGRITYDGVTAYLNGYDHACGGALLNGLREWLADTNQVGQNSSGRPRLFRSFSPRADRPSRGRMTSIVRLSLGSSTCWRGSSSTSQAPTAPCRKPADAPSARLRRGLERAVPGRRPA